MFAKRKKISQKCQAAVRYPQMRTKPPAKPKITILAATAADEAARSWAHPHKTFFPRQVPTGY